MEELNQKEKEFVETFSHFVNGCSRDVRRTGIALTNDHRYLVNEEFKVMIAFMEQLSKNYKKGYYDARNEWACKLASAAIDALVEKKLYYVSEY